MKRLVIVVVASLGFLLGLALRAVDEKGAQVLKQLGLTEEDAKDYIWLDFSHAVLSYPRTEQILAVARGDRVAIVKQLVAHAKAYTKSPEFNRRYETYREGKKPERPELPKSMEEMRSEQKEQLKKSIKETEENMKTLTPEQQEQFKPVLDGLRASLKSVEDPNNPMYSKDVGKMYQQAYEGQLETFKKDSAEWDTQWPPDPKPMLIRRLENFLEVSADVDFNAKVVRDKSGFTTFANPTYEGKSSDWKLCYRAGRETIEAARAAAKEWLQGLKSGN